MPLKIQDPAALGAAASIGGAVPVGYIRNFVAAGAYNNTPDPILLTIYLVPKGGVPDASNKLLERSIPGRKTDMCQELIGRGLNAEGTLQVGGAGLTFGFTAIDTIMG